ncbi:MAG: hypothetical protein JKX73_07495 [Flavobacteriales bacterium]|nr:hypothetical protein [Flavobacteriales bacterium]
MRRLPIYFALLFLSFNIHAQEAIDLTVSSGRDTIVEPERGFWYRPKIVIGLGGHNSLVSGKKVRIGGMRFGLEFKRKWRFGMGLNYLNPPVYSFGGTEQSPIYYRIDFAYFNIFGEYIILNNRRWEISFPLVFGGGATSISSRLDENDLYVPDVAVGLTVRQLSAVCYYKVWKWLGIGASIGYRDVTSRSKDNPKLSEIVTTAFDGPNWAIKTKIYVGELFRALFKKKDKKKKKAKKIDRGNLDSQ